MIGILIIAHGGLGKSLSDCAKHVLGELPEKFTYLAVNTNDDPARLLPQALDLVKSLDSGSGVLVLSDMYGATPCNVVTKLLRAGVVEGVAGINLPMIVRALNYRNEPLSVVVEKAIGGGREGVVKFSRDHCERYDSQ
jgi:mannose PTS system EIIA component